MSMFDTLQTPEAERSWYRIRALAHELGHYILDGDNGIHQTNSAYLMYSESSEYKRYIDLAEANRVRTHGPLPSSPDDDR